jgi:hypothetical protein
MAGTPLKSMFPSGVGLCESLNNRGTACGCRMVYRTKKGTLRCKYHGGTSTGPKTPEGKAQVTQNLRLTPSWKKRLGL